MSHRIPYSRSTSRALIIGALAVILFTIGSLPVAFGQKPPTGFTELFNGKDLTGWHGCPHWDPRKWDSVEQSQRDQWNEDLKQHWRVEDGVLINDGQGVYMTSDQEFRDIELILEYKTVAKADSGVYLRQTPQVQIWDSTEEAKFKLGADKGSGGLWNNSPGAPGKDPLVLADKPFGEWNELLIFQAGARTSVWLNNQPVVKNAIMENFWDREKPLFEKGRIQLQTHGGEIQWRNVYIREIVPEEANAWFKLVLTEDYEPLFNGTDLSGWTGAVDNYEVVDGAIQCKAGKGGVLHTEKEYGDFSVAFEFQLPPGGNNGLAIRYPGKGDTAYVGMCELQILDDSAEKYSQLDSRQYHGSAYGMAAAHRGYLRPQGEWNFQHVTVKGSSIVVELNGTVILDTDLSKVTEFLADSPHPGKDRETGSFGFAGHGDPVRFRNIAIRTHDAD